MYDTFWYCTCLSIHLLITRIVCIEAEVGEGRLAELCEVLVHLDVAEVGVHGRELILKVFCVQRISTLRNEGRIYLSCRQGLPVNGIKERMTLDILSHQPLIGRLDQQFGYEILKLLMYINIIRCEIVVTLASGDMSPLNLRSAPAIFLYKSSMSLESKGWRPMIIS